jgi:catechol 2,3-dioxygenase-like lactoylglutathione lyase family enzyme
MSLFSGAIFIGVSDIDAAVAWYKEKFELRESPDPVIDGEPGDVGLVSRNGAVDVVMRPGSGGPVETPMFDTGNVQKAREWLLARGVNVGPVQTDGQGTRYCEMYDLDNNMIEICEEP